MGDKVPLDPKTRESLIELLAWYKTKPKSVPEKWLLWSIKSIEEMLQSDQDEVEG